MKTLGTEIINALVDAKGSKVLAEGHTSENGLANFYGKKLSIVGGEKDDYVTLLLPTTSMQGETEIQLTTDDLDKQVAISLEEFEGDDKESLEMYAEYIEVPEIDSLITRLVVRSAIDTTILVVPQYATVEEIVEHEANFEKSLVSTDSE